MPKSVLNCTLIPNQGKHSFDPVSKVLTWEVGRIETTKLPNIKGTVRKFKQNSKMQTNILSF